jgi:hypothetical protein
LVLGKQHLSQSSPAIIWRGGQRTLLALDGSSRCGGRSLRGAGRRVRRLRYRVWFPYIAVVVFVKSTQLHRGRSSERPLCFAEPPILVIQLPMCGLTKHNGRGLAAASRRRMPGAGVQVRPRARAACRGAACLRRAAELLPDRRHGQAHAHRAASSQGCHSAAPSPRPRHPTARLWPSGR